MTVAALIWGLFAGNVVNTRFPNQESQAAEIQLNHVKMNLVDIKGHWAETTIKWAQDVGAIDGYPDATFKPNREVTESEFIGMFVRSFGIIPKPQGVFKHWADPLYDFAKTQNYPVLGTNNYALRDVAITRGEVAEIIVGANGYNYLGNDAIAFLLANDYSEGKESATVIGYRGQDSLTRAEAAQFVKNLRDQGMKNIKSRPTALSDSSNVSLPNENLNAYSKAKAVKRRIDQELWNFSGYTSQLSGADLSIVKNTSGEAIIGFSVDDRDVNSSWIAHYAGADSTAVSITTKLVRAVGVPIDDSFPDLIYQALKDGEEQTHEYDGTQVEVKPSPFLEGVVTVVITKS